MALLAERAGLRRTAIYRHLPDTEAVVVAFAEARELKLGKIAQPVRVALTGTSVGPGLYEMLVAMGQTATVRRLASAADRCPAPTA